MLVLTVKKGFSYIKMKPLLVQLVPIVLCPLHVSPCEERTSVLFVATLEVLENCDELSYEPYFLQGEKALLKDLTPSVFHYRAHSPAFSSSSLPSF